MFKQIIDAFKRAILEFDIVKEQRASYEKKIKELQHTPVNTEAEEQLIADLNREKSSHEELKKQFEDLKQQNDMLLTALENLERDRNDRMVNSNIIKQENEKLKAETERFHELIGELSEFKSKEYELISSSNPILLREFYDLITEAQRTIVYGSLRARDINGIAYRDGANDGLAIVKKKINDYYVRATNQKKKEQVIDSGL